MTYNFRGISHILYWNCSGWRCWIIWLACLALVFLLGSFRIVSEMEFSVSSLSLLPILLATWTSGTRGGIVIAFIASLLWLYTSLDSELEFNQSWIHWANFAARLATFNLIVFLIGEIHILLEKERLSSLCDPLTGLPNRRAFIADGINEVERSKRRKHPITVIYLDLDSFKRLNDTKGHEAGDSALISTGKALKAALRSTDYVSRLGGDEFAVILPEVSYEGAVDAAHKISDIVNRALVEFSPVTVSIGVVWYQSGNQSFTTMLKAADELMYEVKNTGKGALKLRRCDSE